MHHRITGTNGTSLAYIRAGETGEPVVFLHGFTGTAHSHFANEITLLAPHMQVYGVDLRGYGASRPPNRVYGVDFYQNDAADVIGFLEALSLGSVHLVGFSDGSETAVMVAALAPQLVKSVVAWGICGRITPEMVTRVRRWLPVSAWGPDREAWKREIIETQGVEQFEPMIAGWVDAAERIAARGGDILHAIAHRVTCPVLIVHGAADEGNPVPVVQELCGRISGAELLLLDGVGHSVQDEAPAALHQAMRRFLRIA